MLNTLASGRIEAALDVWPDEPELNPELLRRTIVATPHVAGYSDDGKRNGTQMVYEAFCAHSGLTPRPATEDSSSTLKAKIGLASDFISLALESACFVPDHDSLLRSLADQPPTLIARGFDRLRKEYPFRRDFQGWHLRCPDAAAANKLAALGFRIN